ncbi:MAG: hypothetical protein ACXW3E_04630 [Thermoanaerobaculia bacterium]
MICVLMVITLAAYAQPIIDQEQAVLSTTVLAVGGSSEEKLAQVFTAGRSGYLTRVTVPIGCTTGAIFNAAIEEAGGGAPSGFIVASETIPGAAFPPPVGSFRIIEFCKPAFIVKGKQYALTLQVLNPTTDSCGVVVGPAGDSYTGGVGYFDALPNPPGWIPMIPELDLAFQTYVDRTICCRR